MERRVCFLISAATQAGRGETRWKNFCWGQWALLAALLAAIAILAASASAAEAPAEPETVFVVLRDSSQRVPETLLAALTAESELHFRRSQLRVEWLRKAGEIDTSGGELILVTLHGNCNIRSEPGAAGKDIPLGQVYVTDGRVLPYVFLECDRIREALARIRSERCLPETWELLARALVRVFDHELMHIRRGNSQHNTHGLGRAAIPAEALIDPLAAATIGETRSSPVKRESDADIE